MDIENKTADTILQKPFTVAVGGETYEVAPPTIATLIEVSRLTAKMPKTNLVKENILMSSLNVAKDCEPIGAIVATLILGADNLTEKKKVVKKSFFGLRSKEQVLTIDNQAILADKILKKLTPKQVNKIIIEILNRMEVGDFFGITASLIEINLLKQTQE